MQLAGQSSHHPIQGPAAGAAAGLGLLAQIRLALPIAFAPRYAFGLGVAGALAMVGLLSWTGGFVNYYPSTGWDFYASTQEIVTMLVLGGLFGLLVPLEVAAIAKARSAAGTAGGLLGTVFGVLSMSCCAPLILPALLSFVGFSGMTLLQVNITVHEWTTPLTLASIVLMLLSIGLVSRTITAVCELPARRMYSCRLRRLVVELCWSMFISTPPPGRTCRIWQGALAAASRRLRSVDRQSHPRDRPRL